MKFIKLTSLGTKEPIYINIEEIGHFYENKEKTYGLDKPKHTRVGVTTHNNGGFEVMETPKDIIQMIQEIK